MKGHSSENPSASSEQVFTFTYSELAAMLHDAQSAHLDVQARLDKVLREMRVQNPAEPDASLMTLPKEIQAAVDRAKEPRRQRKARVIKARVGYTLRDITTKAQFSALQTLLPGEAQILSYIGTHHCPSVQDIAIGTELSVKTAQNCTSTLMQKKLIMSVKL